MGGFEKEERFEAAFQRGQAGEISSLDMWLQETGFDPDRVSQQFLAEFFRKHPEKAPGHQQPLEEIAEYVGFFTQKGGTHHIPVVGVCGIGKTQLLHTVSYMLDQVAEDVPQRRYSAERFSEAGDELEQYFDEVVDDLSGMEEVIVLIDDCEQYKRIVESLDRVEGTVENSLVVTAWTPERWNMDQDRVNEKLPLSKEIYLTPFEETDTVQMLEIAVEAMAAGDPQLPEEVLTRIHEKSYGIPILSIRSLIGVLNEVFLKELDMDDRVTVDAAIERLNLEAATERSYGISDTKMTVLKHILLAYDSRGRRPSELVELLDRDKSTVSYHLQALSSEKVVESEKFGRSTFYRVHENLKPLLQRRIAKQGEHHD